MWNIYAQTHQSSCNDIPTQCCLFSAVTQRTSWRFDLQLNKVSMNLQSLGLGWFSLFSFTLHVKSKFSIDLEIKFWKLLLSFNEHIFDEDFHVTYLKVYFSLLDAFPLEKSIDQRYSWFIIRHHLHLTLSYSCLTFQ